MVASFCAIRTRWQRSASSLSRGSSLDKSSWRERRVADHTLFPRLMNAFRLGCSKHYTVITACPKNSQSQFTLHPYLIENASRKTRYARKKSGWLKFRQINDVVANSHANSSRILIPEWLACLKRYLVDDECHMDSYLTGGWKHTKWQVLNREVRVLLNVNKRLHSDKYRNKKEINMRR